MWKSVRIFPRAGSPVGLSMLLPVLLVVWSAAVSAHSPPAFFRELQYIPPQPGSYDLPVIQMAVDGPVIDTDGKSHRLFDYMGRTFVLLSFVYTSCTDAKGCPLATHVLRQVASYIEAHAGIAEHLRIVTLSFDPDRDTPEVMRQYAGEDGQRYMRFLTTSSAANLQPILDGYGQYIVPERNEDGWFTGFYSHILKVFLIDPDRQVRNIYSVSYLYPQIIINDVKTLIMERGG